MSNNDIHHLAAAYALDALDARERSAFEAHYPSCEVCRADVLDFRATLADVAAAEPIAPPLDMKARVMQQVGQTRQLSPLLPESVVDLAERRRRRSFTSSMLAVAAAVALLVGAASFVIGRSGANDNGGFAGEVEQVLAEPDAQLVDLTGPGAGQVKVAWSASTGRAVVIGDGLADPGSGNVYELWLIDASGPQPMKLLDAASGGDVRRALAVSGSPQAWGVTIEPSGGSPAPTGEILFSAEV
jgi:anti-sigma-K factor RskA